MSLPQTPVIGSYIPRSSTFYAPGTFQIQQLTGTFLKSQFHHSPQKCCQLLVEHFGQSGENIWTPRQKIRPLI